MLPCNKAPKPSLGKEQCLKDTKSISPAGMHPAKPYATAQMMMPEDRACWLDLVVASL